MGESGCGKMGNPSRKPRGEPSVERACRVRLLQPPKTDSALHPCTLNPPPLPSPNQERIEKQLSQRMVLCGLLALHWSFQMPRREQTLQSPASSTPKLEAGRTQRSFAHRQEALGGGSAKALGQSTRQCPPPISLQGLEHQEPTSQSRPGRKATFQSPWQVSQQEAPDLVASGEEKTLQASITIPYTGMQLTKCPPSLTPSLAAPREVEGHSSCSRWTRATAEDQKVAQVSQRIKSRAEVFWIGVWNRKRTLVEMR